MIDDQLLFELLSFDEKQAETAAIRIWTEHGPDEVGERAAELIPVLFHAAGRGGNAGYFLEEELFTEFEDKHLQPAVPFLASVLNSAKSDENVYRVYQMLMIAAPETTRNLAPYLRHAMQQVLSEELKDSIDSILRDAEAT